jgi:phosphoribosylamine--glycine ligase
MARIIQPTVAGMAAEGTPFRGVLYAGLMLTADGPMLIEYNTRFGDPECQVLMMRLKSDLLPALRAARDGVLDHFDLRWRSDPALTVVLAAPGYPDKVTTGGVLDGLDAVAPSDDLAVFLGATRRDGGQLRATGGRVLSVTAVAPDLAAARDRAYAALKAIRLPDGFYRRDIGWRALGR